MLTIDETTWQALLDRVRAAVERQNERCTGNYARYAYELKVTDCGASVLAEVTQYYKGDFGDDKKTNRLGWRKADGAVLKVTVKYGPRRRDGSRQYSIKGQPVVAKTWEKAAARSVKDLIAVSKLTDFIMIGDVRVTQGPTLGGEGYTPME